MSVVVETTIGDLTVDLYTKERPKASLNFIKLCKLKKFNMNLFHMVQPNFIAQTGDPTGTGRGGESVFQELYGNQARYRYWFIYAFKFLSPGGCGFLRNMNKLKIPVLGRNLKSYRCAMNPKPITLSVLYILLCFFNLKRKKDTIPRMTKTSVKISWLFSGIVCCSVFFYYFWSAGILRLSRIPVSSTPRKASSLWWTVGTTCWAHSFSSH